MTLHPSKRAQWLIAFGLSFTVAAAVVTGVAALLAPSPGRGLAVGLAGVALLAAGFALRRPAAPVQVRVTPEGDVLLRNADGEPTDAQLLFVSPWLVVLRHRRAVVPVWADRLGRTEFRHLTVACRWRRFDA